MTPVWRKSSRSGSSGNQSDCVELARLNGRVGVRDSRAPQDGHLNLPSATFADLVSRIKSGDLDL
ncbi:hypothetical protein Acsp03_16160 [Actinomadura sp. NBRC 104412]|uniref:DUF397 domain-containing protein n=1 Tax=Actinomadura sp. NBRC 104412 TaxID=3032203 RepID=UPI0024A3DABD|nr:DUF397 domain-containing protein [Actinomadura sp. NBRC 104412]GLZ04150.1 hypothetical protein Acsp03_16160 [Actinomadura sp. NBRC 104412]